MEKEFKGTKGEWRVEGHDNTTVLSDIEYNGMVADVCAPDKYCSDIAYCSDGTHWEENLKVAQANAQLIAAAPEMLKVLQRLVHLQEYKMENGKWEGYIEERMAIYDDVKKVINKALEL
jgi:hypothetical protein